VTHQLPDELFEHVLIPVASEADARMARETLLPYLRRVGGVATVLHVVEWSEDGVRRTPPSVQVDDAEELFEVVRRDNEGLVAGTRTEYGSNIAETIIEVARDVDASAIVFSPQEKSRLIRLLTGDTALSLVTNPDVPVLAIPRTDG